MKQLFTRNLRILRTRARHRFDPGAWLWSLATSTSGQSTPIPRVSLPIDDVLALDTRRAHTSMVCDDIIRDDSVFDISSSLSRLCVADPLTNFTRKYSHSQASAGRVTRSLTAHHRHCVSVTRRRAQATRTSRGHGSPRPTMCLRCWTYNRCRQRARRGR